MRKYILHDCLYYLKKYYATVCSSFASRLQTLIHHRLIEHSTRCVITLVYALKKHMKKCSHGLIHIWTGSKLLLNICWKSRNAVWIISCLSGCMDHSLWMRQAFSSLLMLTRFMWLSSLMIHTGQRQQKLIWISAKCFFCTVDPWCLRILEE